MAAFSVHVSDVQTVGHPRLYFTASDLPRLRHLRAEGVHARIWKNVAESADWCLTQVIRTNWIAPISPDAIYLNLYDRFYGMMHDMAVMEHLAFAYIYSDENRYFDGARTWALACCRIWKREAEGDPDAGKAYAVMRLLKGLAVSYDLLYDKLSDNERNEIRDALVSIGRKYYQWHLQNPGMAGPAQDKHHGSVEAASFGVVALALLGDVPNASDWLDLMVRKHTDYLLPYALTTGGTQEYASSFWASTMQYRIFFMDPLRRVTGRDLFKEYKKFMDGRIALAAVAGPKQPWQMEVNQSILFAPCYSQLDYWSPVLLYLAREYHRPIYQHLALWDRSLGSIQKTRFVTPNGEQLLFEFGGYAYVWYDPTVPPRIETNLPLSFKFPEVNEVYARASYEAGTLVVGMRRGLLVIHASGLPVFIDTYDVHHEPVNDVTLTDDGVKAIIRCIGVADSGFTEQTVELKRPNVVAINRKTIMDVRWWCHGKPTWKEDKLRWPDGVILSITKGSILSVDSEGYRDEKIVGNGKLKCIDPIPMNYPLVTAQPDDGELVIEVRTILSIR